MGDVTVHWPGGESESFGSLEPDARYRLVRGSGVAEPVAARTHADFADLEPRPGTRLEATVGRIVLVDALPVEPMPVPSLEGGDRTVEDFAGRPLLINLWESTCAACLREFGEFRERR